MVAESAGKLNLVPLKPLSPSSYYMIVATDSLKDSTGNPCVRAATTAPTRAVPAALREQTISGLIALQEWAVQGATGITSDHVIFSDWFGTRSRADVLVAVKGRPHPCSRARPWTPPPCGSRTP